MLLRLIEECKSLLPSCFIFQQDDAPMRLLMYVAQLVRDWIATNCSEFTGKDQWPPNLPDVNPLDYHVWGYA